LNLERAKALKDRTALLTVVSVGGDLALMKKRLSGVLIGGIALGVSGYAAARSCADVNAQTVELELVEVIVDGRPDADRSGYLGATMKVYAMGRTVEVQARAADKFVWLEEYAR
jgi:hypothetical protein